MSILVGEGLIRSVARRPVAAPERVAPPRLRVRRLGETRRPPTRARVVAGRKAGAVAPCAPRRIAVRWPWLVALAVAAGLGVTGLGVLANGVSPSAVPEQTATVSVAPGETLSDIAARFAPGSETGAVVDRIKQLNDLQDAAIVPGLPLTVPVARGVEPARP
ncbi:LysM domain-containing protein [Amycolatopsis xylanica]|uniref:LysM domain-containing protein n=1 Tax=Amycolatopsis xylanica TaxID=589385 RepID=A0A1H3Q2Q5_9PSEU|nr:LysM peptidoglycan-binding domain-containing protein [Amycolatopsis xylanica]SDZ07822.1 LysM domain-containing protein [Amycolatopsis xylanica]